MAVIIYKRQRQILDFIKQHIETEGSAPTLRQIADALNVSSLATVHEHLQTLEAKGLIKREHGKTRAIELIDEKFNPEKKSITVPILGFIAAGSPLEPYTDPNATIDIAPSFAAGGKRIYVLQVRGNSMIEAAIEDGDYVVVQETNVARNGQIVVALLENGMATLKRFYKEATRIRLEPANSTMSPIFAKDVKIQGICVGVIRKFVN
ncbi:MAG TPA: transcriptional repressor LexA [Patescibacteria group bacterium]|nr:transcriptional repressor LexA [Patescibacteria group bacterium]